jgi:rod shape-determining protein MreD
MGYSQRRRIEEQLASEGLLALGLVALAAVQTTMLPRVLGAPPNLLLLLIICQALLAGSANAARWAFYAGLGLDLCSSSVLGSHPLALLAAVLATTIPLLRMSRNNWVLPLLGAFFGAVAYYAVLGLLIHLFVAPVDARQYSLVVLLPGTVVALVPALPLFLVLRVIAGRRRGEVPIDVY